MQHSYSFGGSPSTPFAGVGAVVVGCRALGGAAIIGLRVGRGVGAGDIMDGGGAERGAEWVAEVGCACGCIAGFGIILGLGFVDFTSFENARAVVITATRATPIHGTHWRRQAVQARMAKSTKPQIGATEGTNAARRTRTSGAMRIHMLGPVCVITHVCKSFQKTEIKHLAQPACGGAPQETASLASAAYPPGRCRSALQ